jgi:hypothetical protein
MENTRAFQASARVRKLELEEERLHLLRPEGKPQPRTMGSGARAKLHFGLLHAAGVYPDALHLADRIEACRSFNSGVRYPAGSSDGDLVYLDGDSLRGCDHHPAPLP